MTPKRGVTIKPTQRYFFKVHVIYAKEEQRDDDDAFCLTHFWRHFYWRRHLFCFQENKRYLFVIKEMCLFCCAFFFSFFWKSSKIFVKTSFFFHSVCLISLLLLFIWTPYMYVGVAGNLGIFIKWFKKMFYHLRIPWL